MMDLKIFQPYFINHRTIIEYQEKRLPFSIRDIVHEHAKKSKNTKPYRLFFKVNKNNSIITNLLSLLANDKQDK